MKSYLSLKDCLGLNKIDRNYYDQAGDALSAAGLPSIGSVYGNLTAPTLSDVGSAATEAGNLNTGVNNAFQTYQNYANTLPDPLTSYKALETQNGIPQLRQTSQSLQGGINDLEQAIYRVTPNVSANTGNSLVTDSQRQGMIAAQELPLQQQLTPQTIALGNVNNAITTGESGISNEINALNTSNQQKLGVAGMGVTVAQDNAARAMSGFTADQQITMQSLLKKLDIQKSLDDAEWNTLSTLAENKLNYQNELNKITESSKYIPVNQGGSVVNAQTGQVTRSGQIISPSFSGGSSGGGGTYTGTTLTPQQTSTLDSIFGQQTPNTNTYGLNLDMGATNVSGGSATMKR